jgi:hypothetical protein
VSRFWERQPDETGKAYEAFTCYRDLGPDRSLAKAAESYYGSSTNLAQIGLWSRKFDWVARVRAYDDFLEMERLAAVEDYERKRAADLARRREDLRLLNFENEEKAAQIEAQILAQFAEMPLVRSRAVRYVDGRPVEYVIEPAVSAFDLSAKRLHEIATRSEPAKVDMKTYDLSQATDEQLQRIANGEDPGEVLGLG